MISISCPRCSHAIEVDESRRTSRGKIRVKCNECGAKLSMRPRKGDGPAASSSGEQAEAPAAPSADEGSGEERSPTPDPVESEQAPPEDPHAVVIENLSDSGDQSGLHEALLSLPEFRDNPNRLSDLSNRVPYVIAGLSAHQAHAIEDELKKVVALFSAGPEGEVLVGPLRSYRSSDGDAADNGGGRPTTEPSPSDTFGLDGDLSEGEVALPGDPDDEESLHYQIDGDTEAEVSRVQRALEDDEEGSTSLEGEDSDELLVEANPVSSRDEEVDSSAFGMSMEMEVPVRKNPRRSSGGPSPASAAAGPEGDTPSRMVISNLADLDGFRLEPLGLVTHAFCRKAGGEGIEAKKRIHAFGTRYRKALADLAEQAQALGANTVLGIEIQMQPTGKPENPVVWILVQGTAARRTAL